MRFLGLGPATLLVFLISYSISHGSRIDPAGIKGNFVLSADINNQDAIDEFARLAGEDSKILLLDLDVSNELKTDNKLLVRESLDAKILSIDHDNLEIELKKASAVWLSGHDPKKIETLNKLKAFQDFINRQTVLGAEGQMVQGFGFPFSNLFPGSQILLNREKDFKHEDGKALYELSKESVIILSNRHIKNVGDGEIVISLKKSESKAKKKFHLLRGSRGADLTALRFAAADRKGSPFPAKVLSSPKLENGTLIIIGGGPMPRQIVKQFIQSAGGDEASIVVLPTAVPDSMIPRSSAIAETFRKYGPKEVTVLPGRKINEVDSDKYLDVLKRATGIWFGGGRQWNFVDAYHDTKALKLMHQVLDKGGVIMGSSAGASIQAEYLVRGNPLGNRDMMADGYEKGLGFLKGVAIDQHFAERNRFKDLLSVVEAFPQLLGIGIDEGTALVVEGSTGLVQGAGEVHFYDRKKTIGPNSKNHESVGRGGTYQLVDRKVLNPGKRRENTDKNL